MVAIYLNQVQHGSHGTIARTSLFRIYDSDEVPDDLEARVQNWANTLGLSFDINDYRDEKGMAVTCIYPE